MKRLAVILLSTALLAAALAPQAHAAFGLEEVDLLLREADGSPATQAGSHPYEVVGTVAFNTKPDPNFEFEIPDEAVKAAPSRADAPMTGHNGKLYRAKPVVQAQCGKKRKGKS